MPCDYRNYPENWFSEIRPAILRRAENRCEFCDAKNYEPHPVTGSIVVLTVAHLDHDTWNSDPGNLRALCQRCHNRYDAKMRADRRRRRSHAERGNERTRGE